VGGVKAVGGGAVNGVGALGGGVVGGVKGVGGAAMGGVNAVGGAVGNIPGVGGFQQVFGAVDKSDRGLEKAFKAVDADSSGKISSTEMKAYISKTYGKGFDDKKVEEMMTVADTNKDGEVDLEEFKVIMRAGPKMKTEGVGGAIGGGVGLVGGGVGAVTGGVTKIGGAAIGGVTKVGGAAVGGVSKVGGAAMGGVTGTFGKLGAAAGFQSLFGEVDKSDAGLEKAFKSVDVNGNGKITNAEMTTYIKKSFGEGIDDKMIKDMMGSADTNKDGEIDLEEFKKILRYEAPPEPEPENKGMCIIA